MKISTMGHYGLRSLIDVATHQDSGPVTLADISERQEISVKYLWQVITPLKTAGFLQVTRGAKGGYKLARPAEAINMLDVLTTLEGPIEVIQCTVGKDACPRSSTCVARPMWLDIKTAIEDTLSRTTLALLIQRQSEACVEVSAAT